MKNNITIFLDLDGVLVDWLNGMREFAGLPSSVYDKFRENPDSLTHEAVEPIFGGRDALNTMMWCRPPEFWFGLRFFPWAEPLINRLQSTGYPVAFLTKPGKNPNAAAGKLAWKLALFPDIPIIITADKYLCADRTKVLIDDDDYQLARFHAAGGCKFKWPNQFVMENALKTKLLEDILAQIPTKLSRYNYAIETYSRDITIEM